MDHIEASWVCYGEVGTLNELEQSKICVLTITTLAIAMLTVPYCVIFSVCFMLEPRDIWKKHQLMSFLVKNVLYISHKHVILPVVDICWSLQAHAQYRAGLVQIVALFKTGATCSNIQQNLSCVHCASRLLHIPLWLEANDIFLRTSHPFSLSSSTELPTSLHCHLPLHFHTSILWFQNHISCGDRFECGHHVGWFRVVSGGAACTLVLVYVSIRLSERQWV